MRGWGRERVSTQHEFWPTVAGVGAKLVQRAAVYICAQGKFLLCLEARTVPRHIFHLHTLNSLGEPRAVWTGLFGLFRGCWVVAWLCECVCVLARRRVRIFSGRAKFF